MINRQIKHLARLIEDLLDVSRITRGKIQLRKEIGDITPIIESAVQNVRPMIDERKHLLTVTAARGRCGSTPTRPVSSRFSRTS